MTPKQAPEPGSPIAKPKAPKVVTSRPTAAQLRKAAERLDAIGDAKQADQFHRIAADLARAESKAAKRPKMTAVEQSAEFERIAHEHGAEGNEAEFDSVLRKLARPKAASKS